MPAGENRSKIGWLAFKRGVLLPSLSIVLTVAAVCWTL